MSKHIWSRPIVGASKYAHYGWIVSAHSCHWCLHMSACAQRQNSTLAHKATFWRIGYKVAKINQAIYDVICGLYFTYCLGSTLNSA